VATGEAGVRCPHVSAQRMSTYSTIAHLDPAMYSGHSAGSTNFWDYEEGRHRSLVKVLSLVLLLSRRIIALELTGISLARFFLVSVSICISLRLRGERLFIHQGRIVLIAAYLAGFPPDRRSARENFP